MIILGFDEWCQKRPSPMYFNSCTFALMIWYEKKYSREDRILRMGRLIK